MTSITIDNELLKRMERKIERMEIEDEERKRLYKERGIFMDHPKNGPSTSYGRFFFPRCYYEVTGRPGMSNMGVPRSGPFGSAPFTTPPLAEIATQLRLTRDPLDGWYVLPNGIRFHPDDTTFYKYSVTVLKENPKTFVPDQRKRNPTLGVTNWGLIEHPVDRDLLASFILRQGALDCYDKKLNHNPTRQFIKILEQRKIESVNCERVQSVLGHALIVRIELCENESDVWRTFRVPASIDLSKLHDQVIVPVMGWSRCKKGYVFEDPRDGTVLGIHASKGMYYGTADSLVAADMDYHG